VQCKRRANPFAETATQSLTEDRSDPKRRLENRWAPLPRNREFGNCERCIGNRGIHCQQPQHMLVSWASKSSHYAQRDVAPVRWRLPAWKIWNHRWTQTDTDTVTGRKHRPNYICVDLRSSVVLLVLGSTLGAVGQRPTHSLFLVVATNTESARI